MGQTFKKSEDVKFHKYTLKVDSIATDQFPLIDNTMCLNPWCPVAQFSPNSNILEAILNVIMQTWNDRYGLI